MNDQLLLMDNTRNEWLVLGLQLNDKWYTESLSVIVLVKVFLTLELNDEQ